MTALIIPNDGVKIHERAKANLQSVIHKTGARTENDLIRFVKNRRLSKTLCVDICTALGNLQSLGAIPALLSIIASAKREIGWAAHQALIEIRSQRATRGLMSIVRHPKHREARSNAVYVLKFIKDPRADKLLLEVLHDRRYDDYIRTDAAEGLTWEHPDQVFEALLKTAGDDSPYMRYTAINCLDGFWEQWAGIDDSLKNRVLATLRQCCHDKGCIRGYDCDNGQRARQVLRNYRQFGVRP
jgi:hypothetical protein